MRQLGVLRFLTMVVLATPMQASQFTLATFAREPAAKARLASVRDYIVRKATLRPAASCGSPIACSRVTANTTSRCDRVAGSALYAATPTLRILGAIYYYPGRTASARKPVDASVVDGRTAIEHEYAWHIAPAAAGVLPLLEQLERARFASLSSCERAARETSAAVVVAFRQLLAETQQRELGSRLQSAVSYLKKRQLQE